MKIKFLFFLTVSFFNNHMIICMDHFPPFHDPLDNPAFWLAYNFKKTEQPANNSPVLSGHLLIETSGGDDEEAEAALQQAAHHKEKTDKPKSPEFLERAIRSGEIEKERAKENLSLRATKANEIIETLNDFKAVLDEDDLANACLGGIETALNELKQLHKKHESSSQP